MALTPCPEASAASWLVRSTVPWQRLVRLGPAARPSPRAAVDALVRSTDLDVVPVDPEQPQPQYG